MAELDLGSRKVLKVKFEGKQYDIRFPTMMEAMQVSKKTKDKSEADTVEIMINFLKHLGLKDELLNVLDLESVNKIVDSLMPNKKK